MKSEQFIVKSDSGKEAVFDSRVFREDGWLDRYRLTLQSPKMTVSIEVCNPPWCPSLHGYLRDLAAHWKGWDGNKTWKSGEGELSLDCTMSKQGHACLKITLNVYGSPSDWIAIADFGIEAGQLDALAQAAEKFFGRSRLGPA